MTAREAFVISEKSLEAAGAPEAGAKAKVIVSHALNTDYSCVYTDVDVTDEACGQIRDMLSRCAAGEPVEYVTGKAYFRHLELEVNPCVLIPRKETELVAGCAIELIKQKGYGSALDMCTGSGCIAISLASETNVSVAASDISEGALETAAGNAALNGVFESICFLHSDMFENISGSYDIITCNPPYVSESEYALLDKGVFFEPREALVAGDGLEFYRRIACEAREHINGGGALVLEIGAIQADAVTGMLTQRGFCGVECAKDYAGRDRIVTAFRE